MANQNKIHLGPATENRPQTEDRIAGAAIAPGTIVEIDSSNEFVALTTARSVAGRRAYIASENFTQGRDVNDTNPADQSMIAYKLNPRELYAGLLLAGENVTQIDTPLKMSATAGVLDIGTPGTDHIVAYAKEVFNNTTSGAVRIAISPANV